MNDIINIKEKFKVDDSHSKIRGFVCAYDENGRLVFSKENMIVESGRKFILNNGIKTDSLKYVQLGTSGTPASPNDTIASLNENTSDSTIKTTKKLENGVTLGTGKTIFNLETDFEKLKFDSENKILNDEDSIGTIGEENYFSYDIDTSNLVINCMIVFNGTESITAKSLGIVAQYPNQDFYIVTKDTSKQSGKTYYTKSGATFTTFNGENFATGTDYYENLKNKEVLFSRVTFPTYYKSTHQRLTFKYYIYF